MRRKPEQLIKRISMPYLGWVATYLVVLVFGKREKIFVKHGGNMIANSNFSIGFKTNSFRCRLVLKDFK